MSLDSTNKVDTDYTHSIYKVNVKLDIGEISRSNSSINVEKDYLGLDASVLVDQPFKTANYKTNSLTQLHEEHKHQAEEYKDLIRQETFGFQQQKKNPQRYKSRQVVE